MKVQRKMLIKNNIILIVSLLFFVILTTSFNYENSVQKLDEVTDFDIKNGNFEILKNKKINPNQLISKKDYQNIIINIRDFMLENHIFFDELNRKDFRKECDKLIKANGKHNIIDTQLDCRLLLTSLKQGHVGIDDIFFTKILPIYIVKIDSKYYILACERENKELLGNEILEINDIKIDKVINGLQKYFYGENKNFSEYSTCRFIICYDLLLREGMASGNKVKLKLNNNGTIIQKNIEIIDNKSILLSDIKVYDKYFTIKDKTELQKNINEIYNEILYPLNSIYDYEKLYYIERKKDSLVIRYNSCSENDKYDIEKFAKQISNFMYSYKPKNIIIDLRINGGGNNGLYPDILKKIKLYQMINSNTSIKLLIGQPTYSSGGDAAYLTIKELDNVEIIGKGSGFPVNRMSGNYKLCYVEGIYSFIKYCQDIYEYDYQFIDVFKHNYKNYNYSENMMTPDFYAEQSFADFMIGNDPAMNYALREEGNNSFIDKIKQIFK